MIFRIFEQMNKYLNPFTILLAFFYSFPLDYDKVQKHILLYLNYLHILHLLQFFIISVAKFNNIFNYIKTIPIYCVCYNNSIIFNNPSLIIYFNISKCPPSAANSAIDSEHPTPNSAIYFTISKWPFSAADSAIVI